MAESHEPVGQPPADGPRVETPLSRYLYDAFKRSGMTLESVANRTNLSIATIGFYVNGERGGSGQRRTIGTIRSIAAALPGADPDEAERLADTRNTAEVIRTIEGLDLPKATKRMMLAVYRELHPHG